MGDGWTSRRGGGPVDHDVATFISALRWEMQKQGISQRQLAHRAGMDHSAVSRLLSGETDPLLSTVLKLLRHVDMIYSGGHWWIRS